MQPSGKTQDEPLDFASHLGLGFVAVHVGKVRLFQIIFFRRKAEKKKHDSINFELFWLSLCEVRDANLW